MKARALLPLLVLILQVPIALASPAQNILFTGNVDVDFFIGGVPRQGVQFQNDIIGDRKGPEGGIADEPLGANSYAVLPLGGISQIPPSGFNLERVVWSYNWDLDALYIGLDVCDQRVSWDADSDGNILTVNSDGSAGGTLHSAFSDSGPEEYSVQLDVNRDTHPDATIAVQSQNGGLQPFLDLTYHEEYAPPRAANLLVQLGPLPTNQSSQIPDVELMILNLRTAWPAYSIIGLETRSGTTGDLTNEDVTRQEVALSDPPALLTLAGGILAGLGRLAARRRLRRDSN